MGKPNFVKITTAAYESLTEYDDETLYFVSEHADFDPTSMTGDEKGMIYLGGTLVGRTYVIPVVPTVKTLDTTQTTAQATSSAEALTGSGDVKLHKVSKTGTYTDLVDVPNVRMGGTSTNPKTAVKEGDITNNVATGQYSHAEGSYTKTSAKGSHAEGEYTEAIGNYAHAEGSSGIAFGSYSHIEGRASGNGESSFTITGGANETDFTTSSDPTSALKVGRVVKYGTKYAYVTEVTSSSFSVNTPLSTSAINQEKIYIYSHAVTAAQAHAEGLDNTVTGACAHAEGRNNSAIGGYSHAEGYTSSAKGDYSHAEGRECVSEGSYSHTEGYGCTASGARAHAEGRLSTASGQDAHAEGQSTTASGVQSHAEGIGTQATNPYEHAEGFYNKSNQGGTTPTNTQMSIGIGSSSNRKNAFEVMKNGDVYINNLGGYDGTNATSAASKPIQTCDFVGADDSHAGTRGFVPPPAMSASVKVLTSERNNEWQSVENLLPDVTDVVCLARVHVGDSGLVQNTLCAFNNNDELVSLVVYDKNSNLVPNTWDVFPIGCNIYYYKGNDVAAATGGTDLYDVKLFSSLKDADMRKMMFGTDAQNKEWIGSADASTHRYGAQATLYISCVVIDDNSIGNNGWQIYLASGETEFLISYRNMVTSRAYVRLGSHNASYTTDADWYSMCLEDNNGLYYTYDYADSGSTFTLMEYSHFVSMDCQLKSNMRSTMGSNPSTDNVHYPSIACLYGIVGDIETLLAAI